MKSKTDGGGGDTTVVMTEKPHRRPKSREVSSRFLSPTNSASAIDVAGVQPVDHTVSPLHQKSRASVDGRKHRSHEFMRKLWPAASPALKASEGKKLGTLADHLGNERLKDHLQGKGHDFLSRQSSSTEFSRFENVKESTKENHKPFFGGSMRYTGKFGFPGRSSNSSSSSSSSSKSSPTVGDYIVPGRLSADENALRRKSFGSQRSESFEADSGSECSDLCSSATSFGSPYVGKIPPSASYMSSTVSSRKSGIEVPSKYMRDRSRRGTSDSNIPMPESSPKKFTLKSAMKRANSLTGQGSATTNWAVSPGRSLSPPVVPGAMAGFSTVKPPTSPSRPKGMGNLLLDIFKSKKASSVPLSPLGPGTAEAVHQLRLVHNRWVQWRYANARAEAVDGIIATQAESNLIYALDGLRKLQDSVLQKKLQLEKEKLEMKMEMILHAQIKPLEAWGEIERQHLSAVSMTKDCLHSVVCRVPFIEGAKVEPQSASMALRRALDLTASLKSTLSALSPTAEKTVSMLSELAEVAAQEKSLLEECLEQFNIISTLEIEERSLKCNIIQMKSRQQPQPQPQPQPQEILA